MRRSSEKRGRDVAQKNHTSTRCGNRRRASPKARRRGATLSTNLVFTLISIQRTRVCTSPLYDLSFSRMRRVPCAPYTSSPSVLARMRCAHPSTKSPEGLPKKTHRKKRIRSFPRFSPASMRPRRNSVSPVAGRYRAPFLPVAFCPNRARALCRGPRQTARCGSPRRGAPRPFPCAPPRRSGKVAGALGPPAFGHAPPENPRIGRSPYVLLRKLNSPCRKHLPELNAPNRCAIPRKGAFPGKDILLIPIKLYKQ